MNLRTSLMTVALATAIACGAPRVRTQAAADHNATSGSDRASSAPHGTTQVLTNEPVRTVAASTEPAPSPAPAAPTPSPAPALVQGVTPPLEYIPLPPGATIVFNVEDASIPDLIRILSNTTGARVVISTDANAIAHCASFTVTIHSPTRVRPAQVQRLIASALRSSGLVFRHTPDALVLERDPRVPAPTCSETTAPVAHTTLPAARTTPTLDSALNAQIVGSIRTISPTEHAMPFSMLDTVLEHQAELFEHVRIVPHEGNGRIDGVQLFGLRDGELLSAIGFRNGDVLQTINQLDITTPDGALEAYSRLRNSDVLQFQVIRAGAPVVLTIRREAH